MKKTWWKEAVCYQIYPRSFMDSNGDGIGDLQGIISKLDYLQELGIDVIWICPIYRSPNADNGYDISDYQEIADEYGTIADFDRLLAEAHKRNIKVIMDLVVNHTSDEHPWFIESRSSKDNEKRDWYIWRDGKNGAEPNNWESIFSGSAWAYDKETDQYYMHLFAEKQPDLNWENQEMRSAVYQMMHWWLKKGIDGFRVDAITHIKKRAGYPDLPNPNGQKYVPSFSMHMNQAGIRDYLHDLKEKTLVHYDIMTVGEANGVSTKDAKDWVGETDGIFNMMFQFEHLGAWNEEPNQHLKIVQLKKILSKWQSVLHQVGWNALYLENHDQARSLSTFGNDQEFWCESAKMLATLYFLMQGTPFIYQGQEIGMTNVHYTSIDDYNDIRMKNQYHHEVAKGADPKQVLQFISATSRDNARTPMQWNDSANGGFTTGVPWLKVNDNYLQINVEKQIHNEQSIYSFYKKMIALRKKYPVLIYGEYQLLLENDPAVFAYKRFLQDSEALIICNMVNTEVRLELSVPATLERILYNYHDDQGTILRPFEAKVYVSK